MRTGSCSFHQWVAKFFFVTNFYTLSHREPNPKLNPNSLACSHHGLLIYQRSQDAVNTSCIPTCSLGILYCIENLQITVSVVFSVSS